MLYNWLIKHRYWAYGLVASFLIFTILVYVFKSYWLAGLIYEYIVYWSTALSAAFMLVLAYMAYISITENRRVRAEDKKSDYKRRRVDDVQNWINEVFKLRAESFIPFDEFDTVEMKRRASELFRILANSRWVKIEAMRLDLEVKGEIKLLDKVNRLLFILENTAPKDLGDLPMQVQMDIEKECTEALEHISAIKAKLLV